MATQVPPCSGSCLNGAAPGRAPAGAERHYTTDKINPTTTGTAHSTAPTTPPVARRDPDAPGTEPPKPSGTEERPYSNRRLSQPSTHAPAGTTIADAAMTTAACKDPPAMMLISMIAHRASSA